MKKRRIEKLIDKLIFECTSSTVKIDRVGKYYKELNSLGITWKVKFSSDIDRVNFLDNWYKIIVYIPSLYCNLYQGGNEVVCLSITWCYDIINEVAELEMRAIDEYKKSINGSLEEDIILLHTKAFADDVIIIQ